MLMLRQPLVTFGLTAQLTTFQLTTFMRTDVRADAQRTIELTAQLTTFMRTDVRADAQTTIELTAQLTTFMRTDVRADAQTTAQLTTFMRTDVRADAQTTTELTVQLTTESISESTAQLIEKSIMRVCINDLERPRKLGVSVTFGLTAQLTTFQLTTFVRTDVRADAQTTTRNVWVDRSVNHIPVNHIHED